MKEIKSHHSLSDKEIALSVLSAASDGISSLTQTINQEFLSLCDFIYNLKGKVIISGMGKSGHIGKKIASTLASTGTPSFFVHPGEASHGDLGMITKNDLVILLSNSGTTHELKDIINYSQRFHVPLACFVRNSDSTLASVANFRVILPSSPEALSLHAPTTSSTMMLVLGDALAITLSMKKGFSANDFHAFHPGGRIGASFIKVIDIMHVALELPIVRRDVELMKVIEVITDKNFGCAAVVDDSKKLVGIITDGDLRRNITRDLKILKAEDVMKPDPLTISENSLAIAALDTMNSNKITQLLVLNNHKKVTGLVHMHDCLQFGASPMIK